MRNNIISRVLGGAERFFWNALILCRRMQYRHIDWSNVTVMELD